MHGSDMGDYIGTESGVDLIKGGSCYGGGGDGGGGRRDQRSEMIRKGSKEYPPPISCVARTENVSSSHLPWIMKRYYTGDGRLIIREEKSPNADFLRVRRSNGRLTLQLVPIGQDDVAETGQTEEGRENVETVGEGDVSNVACGGGGGGGNAVVGCGGVGVICYDYETVKTSNSVHFRQVQAM